MTDPENSKVEKNMTDDLSIRWKLTPAEQAAKKEAAQKPNTVLAKTVEEVKRLETLGYHVVTDSELGAGGEV